MTRQEFEHAWEKITALPTRYEKRKDGGVPLLMVNLIRCTTDASLNDFFIPYYKDVEIEDDMVIITKKGSDEPKDRTYIPLSSLIAVSTGKHIDFFLK